MVDAQVNNADSSVLEQIKAVEAKIKRCCDFISVANWGFDEAVQEKLKQRKHRLVNQNLSAKEKKSFTNEKKQRFARTIGGVHTTVSEILDWMSTSVVKDTAPKKAESKKDEKNKNNIISTKKVEAPVLKKFAQESSDEGEDDKDEKVVQEVKVTKPVAAVKPTPRKENAKKDADENKIMNDKQVSDDGDSSDEDEQVATKKAQNKRKAASKEETPAKKTKLDKELEKFDNVDISSLDPIESRKVAMLKLQKKIENMKKSRKGTKVNPCKFEEEKKMKRRMNKLKGKQKRALEKKPKDDQTTEVAKTEPKVAKDEDLPRTEEGNIVYSKFDFIVKDENKKKKRLSTTEKREKFTGKDYKSLLTKVEKRDEKLAKLRETEPEKAKQMEEEIKWNRALKKAEGVKVKDNPELLKKGLKRKEKLKEKKLNKWTSRQEKIKSEQSSKQEKRTSNLQKRIDDKKKKKMQTLRKKGRII